LLDRPDPQQRGTTVSPEDLQYTKDHEWVRSEGETVRVGVTDYAQEALGDIVFVTLPETGTHVTAGDTCGEIESTKSVSDVFAPVTGTVVERNESLDSSPELVNSDPYGEGWMMAIKPDDASSTEGLIDAATYEAGLES
jgi:glycine cleavage system H protein